MSARGVGIYRDVIGSSPAEGTVAGVRTRLHMRALGIER